MLPQLRAPCAICYDTLKQPAKMPGCEHVFCGEDAIEWTREHGNCPFCRDNSIAEVWQIVLLDVQLAEGL